MKIFHHHLFEHSLLYKKINSTTTKAIELLKSREVSGNFIVIAEQQTYGLGRNNNNWFSPKGGLWFTMAIYGMDVKSNLTLHTGIVLHQTILKIFPELQNEVKIKWPNDIYLNNKKIAGILVNHFPANKYHFIGIGINSNIEKFPLEIEEKATSLNIFLNKNIDNKAFLLTFLDIFTENLPNFIEKGLDMGYYKKYDFLFNKTIIIDVIFAQYSGICRGIDRNGAILIRLPNGMIQPFISGSII